MEHKLFAMVLVVVMAGGTCLAQADGSAAEDFKPTSTNQPVAAVSVRSAAGTNPAASAHAAATVRINAGAYEPFTDSDGNVWLPDQGFAGGATIDRHPDTVILETRDRDLFLTERYAMDSFAWEIPNGKYIVNLYFAETFEGIYGPGQRVFSFTVHGHEFSDFDIWEKAGEPYRAYIETVPVEVTDGQFRIDFKSQIENPAINAIEIIPQAPAPASEAGSAPAAETQPTLKAPFETPLKWISSDVLIRPVSDERHNIVSIKDPTIVRYNDLWHVYATVYSTTARTWTMAYLNFKDWSDAPNAKLHFVDENPNLRGYKCAPHLFYFTPHEKWYLVFQSQPPQYCTTDDISKPETWSAPQNFFDRMPASTPRLPIDYHIICDDTHAYLFFTGDDGNFYRSRTCIEDFPKGMSDPEIAIRDHRNNLFEGSITYKIKGADLYLTLIEALSPARYYRAWISDRLDGQWIPVPGADSWDSPFAGINNVRFADGVEPWTRDISHGELIRDGYDEKMILDLDNLQFLYQGRAVDSGGRYELLPYQLGLLTLDRPQSVKRDAQTTASDSEQPALKEVFKDYFLIGGAFNRNLVTGRDPKAADIAIKHYNTATSENDMKWSLIHPQPGQYNWEPADRFMEFCETHHMAPIGHTLVWHSQVPRWVFSDESGNPLSREALLARMKEHITAVVGRYKGRIKGWDVVNEALNDDGTLRNSSWLRIIGEGKPEQQYDHIAKAFEYAHAADPDVELYYNDYNLSTSRAKADGAAAIVRHLQSKGIRIDGVGMQVHAGLTWPEVDDLEYAIKTLSATGVKVMVTELDIRTRTRGPRGAEITQINRRTTDDPEAALAEIQQKLADKYAEIFSVLVKHKDVIPRVTFWGVYDTTSWIGGSPLLFDGDYQPKQAFNAVVNVVREQK